MYDDTYVSHSQLHKVRVGGGDKMLEVSPLSCAAAIGNTDMVQLLVQNGASIHASAVSTIQCCVCAVQIHKHMYILFEAPLTV